MTNQPTTPATPGTFRVLADALPLIQSKLESAAKKAVKLGFAAPTLNIIEWVNVKVEAKGKNKAKVVRYAEISVEGDAPKLAGWTFIASLQVLGEESVVRTAPGQTLPKQYLKADPTRCEHCKLSRRRNDTFVLVHENGEARQVGRTCLRDFFGHNSPELVAKYAEILFRIREEIEAAGDEKWYASSASSARYSLDLSEFLAAVATEIRLNGWVSGKVARERETASTSQIVWNGFFPISLIGYEAPPEPTEADRKLATDAQAWAESLPENDESEYLHNVRVIAGFGAVDYRLVGYAGSIIVAYQRRQEEAKRTAKSGHFGTVGQKFEGKLKVLAVADRNTYFLVRFENADGYEAVWFANSDPKLVEGRTYTVTAKVKEHAEFRGAKNTKLAYVEVKAEQVSQAVVNSDACPF